MIKTDGFRSLNRYKRHMRVAHKGKDLWLVVSEDESRTHDIELGDDVTFERSDGTVLMAITKRRCLVRRPKA